MKRINLNRMREGRGLRQALGNTQLSSGYMMQTMTSTTNDKPLTKATFRILLHGIYVGHHFDGGFRGGTGEFYWYSTVSDGNDLHVTDSREAIQFGKNGILTGVRKQTWLDLGMVELFRSSKPPKHKNGVFAFTLMESDDGDEAKKIFKASTTAASRVAKHLTGFDSANIAKEAVNVFNSIIDADDDDHAIQGIKGLDYLTNYNVGQFIRIEGKRHDRRPTFAICSIVPHDNYEDDDFSIYEETGVYVPPGAGVTHHVDLPSDGHLSVFIRVRSGGQNGVMAIGAHNKLLSNFNWTILKTKEVKKGRYPIHLKSLFGNTRVDMRVMFTSSDFKKSFV